MVTNKNELLIVCDRNHNSKTEFIIDDINKSEKNIKILFFSLEKEKPYILNEYCLNVNINNLKIIDIPITIEKIKEYIESEKADIVYIDYIQLVGGASHIRDFNIQQHFILDQLNNYANKFNIKIIVTYLLNPQTSNKDIIEDLKDYKILLL